MRTSSTTARYHLTKPEQKSRHTREVKGDEERAGEEEEVEQEENLNLRKFLTLHLVNKTRTTTRVTAEGTTAAGAIDERRGVGCAGRARTWRQNTEKKPEKGDGGNPSR
ncbi:hypothetical protein RUM43_005634 [Polyplax serrata]|uniref:Uncharacterized protein n=1 Tax=Polyplax serrata TaxID=468196 RepID=A0AAN8NQJ6_POLSC